MIPYADLSDREKNKDRNSIKATLPRLWFENSNEPKIEPNTRT